MAQEDLLWGLMMMVVGMGVVFALLLALMLVLIGIGRLDRQAGEELAPEPDEAVGATRPGGSDEPAEVDAAAAAPVVRIIADGLDEDQVAAIVVAVTTHAENRRRLAAPETRSHAPGSQLFASRWLSVGRGNQTHPFTRR